MPARWGDGHVQVFARGTDNHLYTSDSVSTSDDAGLAFSSFTVVNASQVIAGEPSVLAYPAYGPEIFARDAKGDVIHMTSEAGTWSAWKNDLGQVITSDPLAWVRPDGLGEVFGIDAKGDVVKSLHGTPTAWSAWSVIGKGFDACLGGTRLVDAGVPVTPADAGARADAGIRRDAGPIDARAHHDGGPIEAAATQSDAGPSSASSGCSCRAAGGPEGRGRQVAALLVLALVAFGRGASRTMVSRRASRGSAATRSRSGPLQQADQ